jgi:hypothetical protein
MKLNNNSMGDNQRNYQKIQSGKLADAIYRNNTTYRKQLETELQKLEIDTLKAQRNLELTQIAFRNKLRNQRQEWARQQEKNFTKMYHYVYTKKDEIESSDNRGSYKSRNHSLKVNNRTEMDDFDELLSDDDDDFDVINGEDNKKPILVLMKSSLHKKQEHQVPENSNSNLVEKQQKPINKLSNTNNIINISSKPTNYSQLIQAANSRLVESNNSLKVSSKNAFFVPVKASNIEITVQDTVIFQSNSTNALKVHKPTTQKLTQSSLSFTNTNSSKREPFNFAAFEKTSASSSILKLPPCGKELKSEGSRSNFRNNSNNNFKSVQIKDPLLKNPESIEVKSLKSSISSSSKTQPPNIQQTNIPQVQLRLTSALINKQKFENRLKPFLKTNIEIQKQHKQEIEMQIEQEKKLKSEVLNDERFTNLVSSLGTLGAA